jgi:hypothetical protein
MASRVSRSIALPFLDRGIRKGWVVNSTPQPHFTPGKDTVHIVQEAGWAPGPVWTGGISRLTGIRSLERPARSHPLYRLSYLAHLNLSDWYKIDHRFILKQMKIHTTWVYVWKLSETRVFSCVGKHFTTIGLHTLKKLRTIYQSTRCYVPQDMKLRCYACYLLAWH